MGARLALTSLLAASCLAVVGTRAQAMEEHAPVGAVETKGVKTPGELNSKQIELVRKVSVKGAFVQTSAGGTRLRGKYYVMHPGRFRFDFAFPSRLVIISDGRYVAIQDHDLKAEDRWELNQTPFGVLQGPDVDLLRDAHFFEEQDMGDTMVITFEDKRQLVPGPLKMFLGRNRDLSRKNGSPRTCKVWIRSSS